MRNTNRWCTVCKVPPVYLITLQNIWSLNTHSCRNSNDIKSLSGCEYGDHKSWCGRIKRSQCYNERTRTDCCETCRHFETDIPGKFRASWFILFDQIHYGHMWQFIEIISLSSSCWLGCEHGDRASWCANITTSECYVNHDMCCQTCAHLRRTNSGVHYTRYRIVTPHIICLCIV